MARKSQGESQGDEPDIEDFIKPPRTTSKQLKADGDQTVDASSVREGGFLRHRESVHDFGMKELRDVRVNLLTWYDAHRRKLPWRGDPPPYLTTATHTKQTAIAKTEQTKNGTIDAFFVSKKLKAQREQECEPVDTTIEDARDQKGDDAIMSGPAALPRKVTPYETWVSEIMLQQTRVDTVVEYFLRWTEKFPTIEALASGSEEVRLLCSLISDREGR